MKALVLSLLGTVALAACGGDGGAPSESATPTSSPAASGAFSPSPVASASPTPTVSPTPAAATPTREPGAISMADTLTLADAVPLPVGVALIIETGCWGCSGYTGGFVRAYRDADGTVRAETLLSPTILAAPPLSFPMRITECPEGPCQSFPYIIGFAMSEDGRDIAATICTASYCGPGGEDSYSPDARSALIRSHDGGVTWQKMAEFDRGVAAKALLSDGRLLLSMHDGNLQSSLHLYPGDALAVPQIRDFSAYSPVFVLPGDQLAWPQNNQFLSLHAMPLLTLSPGQQVGGYGGIAVSPLGDGIVAVRWESGGQQTNGLVLEAAGEVLDSATTPLPLYPGAWPEPSTLFGATYVPGAVVGLMAPDIGNVPAPVLVDLPAGQIHPLADVVVAAPLGRSLVRAVQTGPFARVTGTASCLNLRAGPSASAAVLDCLADGVLLTDTRETRDADGRTWLRVFTPAHTEGWVGAEYVER